MEKVLSFLGIDECTNVGQDKVKPALYHLQFSSLFFFFVYAESDRLFVWDVKTSFSVFLITIKLKAICTKFSLLCLLNISQHHTTFLNLTSFKPIYLAYCGV